MKAFGIEIRKADTIGNLFAEVDAVLSKHKIPALAITANIQMQAVAHALQDMMRAEKWFNVCTIDNCIKVAQVSIPVERYNIYRSAHCINWSAMAPEYREALIAMVLDDFRTILHPAEALAEYNKTEIKKA